jgi:hypothetical protein
LFADEHVDDAATAEYSLHHNATGAVIIYLADLRGFFAERM